MKRQGSVLIAVLWVIAIASSIASLVLRSAHIGGRATANRIVHAKARWAAEACGAIAMDREPGDSIALSHTVWCRMRMTDAGARININRYDSVFLRSCLQSVELGFEDVNAVMQRILRERARGSGVRSLTQLGVSSADSVGRARFAEVFAFEGPQRVNVNAASAAVLRCLPGVSEALVQEILAERRLGNQTDDIYEIVRRVPRSAQDIFAIHALHFERITTLKSDQLTLTSTGFVAGSAVTAELELRLVPIGERLAIVGRRLR